MVEFATDRAATGVLLVDHGSNIESANASLSERARAMRDTGAYTSVRHAHMELAEPTIEQGFDTLVADGVVHIVVLPYFLALGKHASRDIPQLCEQAATRHNDLSWQLAAPVGTAAAMHAVIDELISASLARK